MSNARNLARLLPNASGQLPDAAMASGSVLQVQYATGSYGSSTSSSWVDDGLTVSITPSAANNKIMVIVQTGCSVAGSGSWANLQILESVGSTSICEIAFGNFSGSPQQLNGVNLVGFYTAPNTAQRTFKLQGKVGGNAGAIRYINYATTPPAIIAMEIAA